MTAVGMESEEVVLETVATAGDRGGWWRTSIYGFLGLGAMAATTLVDSGGVSTFTWSSPGEGNLRSDLVVSTTVAIGVLGGVLLVLAVASALVTVRRSRALPWLMPVYTVVAVMAFLVLVTSGKSMSLVGLLSGTLLLSVPLVYGSLSGLLCEKAGVINIAIEGQLLSGAFTAAMVASLTNSVWVGLVGAVIASTLVSTVLALFSIRYLVSQIVVGVVLNVLVSGLTTFFFLQVLVTDAEVFNSPDRLPSVALPALSQIPVLGPVLFNQSVLVYFMYIAVAVVYIAMMRTKWGLRVRAVGEHPLAADTVGIDVNAVRWRNILLSGVLGGLGGAYFTIGTVGAFGRDMTAGAGFIALAALIFGRWNPLGVLGASLLFAFANSLQQTLSTMGTTVPQALLLVTPYVVTVIAVSAFAGKVKAPAALGKPYQKEG